MRERITPETYIKMNEEFEEDGVAFRIIVPTQEQIDKHLKNLLEGEDHEDTDS